MDEELENIYASMAEAVRDGGAELARDHMDGLTEAEKIRMMAHATRLIQLHKLLREELVIHTDQSSWYADRKAMGHACEVPPSTLYAWLARRGQPRNRREPT